MLQSCLGIITRKRTFGCTELICSQIRDISKRWLYADSSANFKSIWVFGGLTLRTSIVRKSWNRKWGSWVKFDLNTWVDVQWTTDSAVPLIMINLFSDMILQNMYFSTFYIKFLCIWNKNFIIFPNFQLHHLS